MFYSNFKPFSCGIVIADKERDSMEIKVYPYELLPHMSEEIDDSIRHRKKQGIDHVENLYTVELDEQLWLPAKWLGSTYFEKAPDVSKGEQVLIYRSGDGDEYYWDVFGRNDSHRKQEDVIISFSAKPDYDAGTPVPKDETNSYRLRFNTYDKFIQLTTSEANEELVTYSMRFDMGVGTFELKDGETNRFFLDSVNTIMEMYNKDNSYVRLDQKNVYINSEDLIQHDTNEYTINCTTYALNCTDATINASSSLTMETASATMNADTAALNFGSCTVGDGAWNCNAAFTFSKPVTMSGGMSAGSSGTAAFKGKVTFSIPLIGYDKFKIVGN